MDRTAYPRPGGPLTREELRARYNLTDADRAFIHVTARGDAGRLMLAALLKTRQNLGYFPALSDVHADTATYLTSQLTRAVAPPRLGEERATKTLYRYQTAVRGYLSVTPYAAAGERLVTSTVLEAAETMSDPADLINRSIEALHDAAIDLPAFSSLDRLVNHLRTKVHARIYDRIAVRLAPESAAVLDAMLVAPAGGTTTEFNRLKQAPGPAHFGTIKLWTDRLDWLAGLIDPDPLLAGVTHTKLRQFAAEAATLEVSELLDISQRGKRHTLLLSLLRQARTRCRDELIEMLLRRVRRTQAAAKEKLEVLHDRNREIEETLICVFGQVLETARDKEETDAAFGRRVKNLLVERGGVELLAEQCETVSAAHHNNDLPLLWPIHAKIRTLLFRLLDLMDIRSATQDRSLLDALAIVAEHRHTRHDELPGRVDLHFASPRWRSFVAKRRSGRIVVDRRALEVCVFVHLADALQSGDLYIVGAENFADYRAQPLPWSECQPRLEAYCEAVRLPQSGMNFAALLKDELTKAAAEVDAGFPTNSELSIDTDGTLHLKQLPATNQPEGLAEFEQEIRARMPERHLLDILKHAEHWARYTRATSGRHPAPIRSSLTPYDATSLPSSAMAAISVPVRPLATPQTLLRRRRCAESTPSTSTPTSWRRRWSM